MRKSGILMHITSLPNPYGIGSVGQCAFDFVDFLSDAGQTYWQVLPLNPTGFGDSPYQSFSSAAGNHYLIDLDILIREGLLKQEEADAVCWGNDEGRVDYGCLYQHRTRLLRRAFERFVPDDAFRAFLAENRGWLEDYALFMALKEQYQGQPWQNWPEELVMRNSEALAQSRRELATEISFHCFLQHRFFLQWSALRGYANSKGIRIIGDIPIYVPLDSADVWAEPQLFQLDSHYRPKLVAGCPPDSFTADGQLWGNPLYDWGKLKQTRYDWWIRRLSAAARMYDVVRLDHFRGFESYWAVPAGDTTAAGGSWLPGPGMDLIQTVRGALPELEFIAEDLGYVTAEVRALQEDSGYPGMKVMLFAFDSREDADYLPHTYPVNSVCYPGTHDNVTVAQWFREAAPEDIAMARDYLGLNAEEGFVRGIIRGCMSSVSRLCVVQLQDYLELGAEARMNFPGKLSPDNWSWRVKKASLTQALARYIHDTTRRYGRL